MGPVDGQHRVEGAGSSRSAVRDGVGQLAAILSPGEKPLRGVLRRIPKRWAPCIDVEPGWDALIIETDAQLAAVDPDYVVLQIKEKFGALRYYCQPSGDDPAPEVCDALDTITDEAERRSATICERCGQPGRLSDFAGRLKTLCQRCTEK